MDDGQFPDADARDRFQGGLTTQNRGTNQRGMRQRNELLVLSLIRSHGQLAKAEIAKLTGLTPQAVTGIVGSLEGDGLVLRSPVQKGRVGQPSQPFKLNPDGAYSIGLKVGRRSGDLLLLDLAGQVRMALHQPYEFPTPQQFLSFAREGLDRITSSLGDDAQQRIAGLGVAAPFDLWKWEEEAGAPHDVMEAWQHFDLAREIAAIASWPVHHCNDATAACAAERFFGLGQNLRDYAYIYVGYFVGGGVVIDGHVRLGKTGNAGALGSIIVPSRDGKGEQLIRSASLSLLERMLIKQGTDPRVLFTADADWSDLGQPLVDWIHIAAHGLAYAAANLAATLECEAVIIDGSMPTEVRHALLEATRRALKDVKLDGITPFALEEGTIGPSARAMGGASLPLTANFMLGVDGSN
jgi:predicted NBD/HSP70 family sugar kinase